MRGSPKLREFNKDLRQTIMPSCIAAVPPFALLCPVLAGQSATSFDLSLLSSRPARARWLVVHSFARRVREQRRRPEHHPITPPENAHRAAQETSTSREALKRQRRSRQGPSGACPRRVRPPFREQRAPSASGPKSGFPRSTRCSQDPTYRHTASRPAPQ